MEPGTIYDISPRVSGRTAVFPGDQPFDRQVTMSCKSGDPFELSRVLSTLHVGAHADAPSHYHRDGRSIETRELDRYLGECQVASVRLAPGERILPSHFQAPVRARRVLFKTGSFPDAERWRGDFNSLSPELIDRLADQGVRLVGLDTPSVDPADSKALESHQAIFRRDLAILEGLELAAVPDGVYTLIALPLRLEGADASPVRAVLVEDWRSA